jgi:putative OPT family oligopeptide transporter
MPEEPGTASSASELTPRALAAGLFVGCLVGASNVTIGLKGGLTFGATMTAAVLPFALFRVLERFLARPFGPRENMIATTAGSAAGSMATAAGVISFVPALAMTGVHLSPAALTLWTLTTASLGVLFAVPLRRQMIIVEKLKYPSGTAAAHTITAMYAAGDDALSKARVLLVAAAVSSGVSLLFALKPLGLEWLELISFDDVGLAALGAAGVGYATLRLGLNVSPMLLGAGVLVGRRTGLSLFFGSIAAWAIGAPLLIDLGVIAAGDTATTYTNVLRWLVWPGAAMMVAAGLTSLVYQRRFLSRALQSLRRPSAIDPMDDSPDPMSARTWLLLICPVALATTMLAWFLFDIPPWMGLIAILVSFVMAVVAVRATAETDLNPVGPMAKVTQLVYGALDPGNVTTNLMAAGITAAGASQAGDLMHDLKAGYLLKVSARRQIIAQLAGVGVGVFAVVGAYEVLAATYPIPGDTFAGPAVQSWYAMARVLTLGVAALPAGAGVAAGSAALLGVLLTILSREPRLARYLPSPVALSIACLVPAAYAWTLALGSLIPGLMNRCRTGLADRFAAPLASGLIAGEGLMMVLVALFKVLGVPWF